MKAMSSVLWVVVLIILYIYIFAVAAVVLFGSFDIDGPAEFTNLTEGGTPAVGAPYLARWRRCCSS